MVNERRPFAECVDQASAISGVLTVSIADAETGEILGVSGALGAAVPSGTGWAEAGRSALQSAAAALEVGEEIEELVMSGGRSFHLLRLTPQREGERRAVIHMILDRTRTNLAMTRLEVKAIAETICLQVPVQRQVPFEAPPQAPSESITGRAPPLPKRTPDHSRALRPPPRPSGMGEEIPERMAGFDIDEPDTPALRRVVDALRKFL